MLARHPAVAARAPAHSVLPGWAIAMLGGIFSSLAASAQADSCQLEWSDQFPAGTLNGNVAALAVFDDGNGPALYVGGGFTVAGGLTVNRIARWDGTTWSALGLGMSSSVFALAVFDDDGDGPNPPALYAAGAFTMAGDVAANRIARWDGHAWSSIDWGLNNVGYALTVFDADGSGPGPAALYIGGLFTVAGGAGANRVAKWDGATWSSLGSGTNNFVYTLAVFDDDGDGPNPPALYAGGGFTLAGGNSGRRVAKWDGTSWIQLKAAPNEEDGVNNSVYKLAVFDDDGAGPHAPALYLGGYFTMAGATSANGIVRWDGQSWSPLGSGLNGPVWTLAVFDDDEGDPAPPVLYVGGSFTTAGGAGASNIARWDGGAWSALGSGTNDGVLALTGFDDDGPGPYQPALFAGGSFTVAGGLSSDHIARWGCPLTASPPVIARQPESCMACPGGSATFSVWAWGTRPLAYQWRKDGQALAGATAASYTVNAVGPNDVGQYDVIVSNTFGTVTSDPATLTLAVPVSITQQPQSRSACMGDVVTFTVAGAGESPLSYQWYHDDSIIFGANSPSYTINPVKLSSAGVYTATVTNLCGEVTSDPATLTVAAGPVITQQPQSQTVCEGGAVTFSVVAGGPLPLAYQWRKGGQPIPGATAASYVINPVQHSDAGVYDVQVSSACGTVASNPATLTVQARPVIVAPPQSREVCAGGSVTLSVQASGEPPLSYQWRKNGQPISGATAATYTVNPVGLADAGAYDVVVTNLCGSVTSAAATLTVYAGATIAEQPQSQSVCSGGAVTFQVSASGMPPLTYQWRKDGQAIAGATNAVYTINPVAAGDAGQYDVVVGSACGSTTSNLAALTVNAGPVITGQPQPQAACVGGTATFVVTANGTPPLTYQWRKDGQAIAGATGATYSISSVVLEDAGQYDAVVTNVCGSTTSNAATLTVNTGPAIVEQPQSQAACVGGTATFVVTANGTPPLTYQWRKDEQAIAGATAATYALDPVAASDAGQYDVVVGSPCGSATSAAATLTVNAGTVIVQQPESRSVCAGSAVSFTVSASGTPPLTYQWRKGGQAIPGANAASYVINPVQNSDAGVYDVQVSSACGMVVSNPATLTVQAGPAIVAPPQSREVCAGGSVTFSVQASGEPPLSYQWRKDGQVIAGATGSTCTIERVEAAHVGAYDVVVSCACGSATSNAALLTIASPVVIVAQPQGQSACLGGAVTFAVGASGADTLTYQWRKDDQPIDGASAQSYKIEPVTRQHAGRYDVVVADACGAATSAAAALTVIECNLLPAAPSDPVPPDGASAVPSDVELRWTSAAATSYDVYFGMGGSLARLGATAAPRWAVKRLDHGTTYRWRIVARNGAGESPGPVWSFATEPAPSGGSDGQAPPTAIPTPGGQDAPDGTVPDQSTPPGSTADGDATRVEPGANDGNQPDATGSAEDLLARCGAGTCGAGYLGTVPLTILCLSGMKLQRRRQRHRQQCSGSAYRQR